MRTIGARGFTASWDRQPDLADANRLNGRVIDPAVTLFRRLQRAGDYANLSPYSAAFWFRRCRERRGNSPSNSPLCDQRTTHNFLCMIEPFIKESGSRK